MKIAHVSPVVLRELRRRIWDVAPSRLPQYALVRTIGELLEDHDHRHGGANDVLVRVNWSWMSTCCTELIEAIQAYPTADTRILHDLVDFYTMYNDKWVDERAEARRKNEDINVDGRQVSP